MPDLASRLWNPDETGFCTAVASRRVLARRDAKGVHETSGGSGREFFMVLGAGSANGVRLPPYILYKGMNLFLRWSNGGPAGAMYGVSCSGWMEANNFLTWFTKFSSQQSITSYPQVLCCYSWMATTPTCLFL